MNRRACRTIRVRDVEIGGSAPISVQSMTNTDTRDAMATLAQIEKLHKAGADLVRISVYDEACVRSVRKLVDYSPVPLIADIHFDHRLAIGAMENGIHKLRINPGPSKAAWRMTTCLRSLKSLHPTWRTKREIVASERPRARASWPMEEKRNPSVLLEM